MKAFSPMASQLARRSLLGLMLVMSLLCWWQILHTQHANNGLAFAVSQQHTDVQAVSMAMNDTFVVKKSDPSLVKGMVLLGVVSRVGQPALALLQFGAGQAQWYQEGQEVISGLRLDSVWPQAITLSANGQLSTLVLAHRAD